MRPAPLAPLVSLLLVLGGGAPGARAGEEPLKDHPTSRLTATLEALWEGDGGALGENDFRLRLSVENPGPDRLEIRSGNLLVRSEGGWLTPIDPPALPGAFLKDLALEAGGAQKVEPPIYKVCGSVRDALVVLEASDGHALFCAPLAASGGKTSGAGASGSPGGAAACAPPGWPLGLGVQGPLEVVPYADGRRSVVVVGQVQVLGRGALTAMKGSVLVASDQGAGAAVEWSGGVGDGLAPGLWPFLQRLDVASDFAAGTVSVRVKAALDGREVAAALDVPVRAVEPFVCVGPVLGSWQLGNGPAERQLHANLLQLKSRYAYDLVVMQDGRTHSGDVGRNQSYYAFERSVRAVADGEVVEVVQDQPDVSGASASTSPCLFTPSNRVVLRHEGGVYTAYLHLRQGKVPGTVAKGAHVQAGSLIGLVGNSGYSSEPHLHLLAFRHNEAGALLPVPLTFKNAFADAQGRQPLSGVPVGGTAVHFLDAPPR